MDASFRSFAHFEQKWGSKNTGKADLMLMLLLSITEVKQFWRR
jgi:hypothetical protein